VLFHFLADPWINRSRHVDPAALASVDGLVPAVAVTGGSSGIGLAIAARFAKARQRVALVARNEERLAAAAEAVRQRTGQLPIVIVCDVTDASAAKAIEERLRGEGCYLDILVNNAGAGSGGAFVNRDGAESQAVIDINIAALTRLTRLVLPDMLARGRGGIINVASLGGLLPGPYQNVYYASKAYVISFTRALAFEVSGQGVRVSCVAPGPVRTSFHDAMDSQRRALYRYLLVWSSPERVAASVYRGYQLGHPLIVPGLINWLLSKAAGVLPYFLAVPLMGMLLHPGTHHDRDGGTK